MTHTTETLITKAAAGSGRRSFLATVIGLVVGWVPLVSGLVVFLSPLRRKGGSAEFVPIATLDAIPDDSLPHRFPVIKEREDAWNRYPPAPVGAVYLVRQPGSGVPIAFTATCPHAGCFIGYRAGDEKFQCPCHTSAFQFDGLRIGGDQSVAPRDMDRLEVEVRKTTSTDGTSLDEVFVKFQRFQTGRHKKIPLV